MDTKTNSPKNDKNHIFHNKYKKRELRKARNSLPTLLNKNVNL